MNETLTAWKAGFSSDLVKTKMSTARTAPMTITRPHTGNTAPIVIKPTAKKKINLLLCVCTCNYVRLKEGRTGVI